MNADTIEVRDCDGDSRLLPAREMDALVRDNLALACPNDEDDEASGWHGHIHVTWEELDARQVLTT